MKLFNRKITWLEVAIILILLLLPLRFVWLWLSWDTFQHQAATATPADWLLVVLIVVLLKWWERN